MPAIRSLRSFRARERKKKKESMILCEPGVAYTQVLREVVSMTRWPLHCSCSRICLSVFVKCLTYGYGKTDRGTEACHWSPHIPFFLSFVLFSSFLPPSWPAILVHASFHADDADEPNFCLFYPVCPGWCTTNEFVHNKRRHLIHSLKKGSSEYFDLNKSTSLAIRLEVTPSFHGF